MYSQSSLHCSSDKALPNDISALTELVEDVEVFHLASNVLSTSEMLSLSGLFQQLMFITLKV
jgi:hypothetical protein